VYYFISTKKGMGAELWGTYDDLRTIYEVIGNFWNRDGFTEKEGFSSRDQVISGFAHEIRKAYEGSRLTRNHSHIMPDPVVHFGCKLSWVHLIFAMNAIRFNMRFFESNKMDLGLMLQLEYWLEDALNNYDKLGATALIPYLNGGIEQGNPYIYQFMRSINAEHFQLKWGKTSFRKLGQLLRKAVYGTEEYRKYHTELIIDAQQLGCKINELEINDDHIDYSDNIW
jgi:hypothetical protein